MRNPSPSPSLSTRIRALMVGTLLAASVLASGCIFSDESPIDEGVVRSEQADVYSSTALVALKVTTVKRGDTVDILRREAVTGPTSTENWLQIRLKSDTEMSGWIEARHVVSESVVKKTEEVAGNAGTEPAIARGRLKVNQKLRLAAGRDSDVAAILSRGTEFDIVGKGQTRYKPERKAKPEGEDDEAAPDEPEDEEAKTDVWYRVRLDEGAIIRGGWVLALSVSLEVPDEILHLEGEGRRFVAWQVVGTVNDAKLAAQSPETAKRNNYVTFMRRANAPDDVDFERIYCLFWDTDTHNYYAPYVESDLRGVFPITQREEGNRKIVTLNVLDERNEHVPVELEIALGEKGRYVVRRITPPIRGERIVRRR